jgi:hypothetical protein
LKNKLPISIVIPSLGGPTLINTLKCLNKDNEIPDEIICVIPAEKFNQHDYFLENNIIIVKTNFFGQVQQRVEGFKHVKNELVLQLDDDIEININDIKELMRHLNKLDDKSSIGPQYFDKYRNKFYYKSIQGWQYYESMLIDFLIGNAKFGDSRMGTVSKIGKNYGVDIKKMKDSLKEVEWLAGGCVMHYKQNLLLENYYPYTGKAYCEDVIHSILLRKKEVKLWICKDAICSLSDKPQILDVTESKKEENAILYIIKMINGNLFLYKMNKMYWNSRNFIIKFIFK